MLKAFSIAVAVALTACGARAAPPPPATDARPAATALVATLSVARERYASGPDVEVLVVLENRSAAPVDLPAQVLESAQLLLRVRDGRGADVASGPPPTPRPDTTTIAPGQRLTKKLRLDVFSPPLAAGDYSVTLRSADVESNTVRFHLGS